MVKSLTLYDYLPSQNAYKVRLLLSHLQRPYATGIVSILEADPFENAKVQQWMSFEQEYVNSIATLRHWNLTGKLARRAPALVERHGAKAARALAILERELALADHPAVVRWIERVRAQPGFLGTCHPYSIDPLSSGDLP